MKDVEFKNVIDFIRNLARKLSTANGIDENLFGRVINEIIIDECIGRLRACHSSITRESGEVVDIINDGYGPADKDNFHYSAEEAVSIVERERATEGLEREIFALRYKEITSNFYADKDMVCVCFMHDRAFLGSLILDTRSMKSDGDGMISDIIEFIKQRNENSSNGLLKLADIFYRHYRLSLDKEFGEAEIVRCAILGSAFLLIDECVMNANDEIESGIATNAVLAYCDRAEDLREEIRSAIDEYIEKRPDLDSFLCDYMAEDCYGSGGNYFSDDCNFGDYNDDYDDDYDDEFGDDDDE